MRTIGIHTRVASFVGAVALLLQISPALATDHDRDKERNVLCKQASARFWDRHFAGELLFCIIVRGR